MISFVMGVGDAMAQSQLMNLLGSLYSENAAPAFALFKFVQVRTQCFHEFNTVFVIITNENSVVI